MPETVITQNVLVRQISPVILTLRWRRRRGTSCGRCGCIQRGRRSQSLGRGVGGLEGKRGIEKGEGGFGGIEGIGVGGQGGGGEGGEQGEGAGAGRARTRSRGTIEGGMR
jgi:hypothetical protein